MSESDKVFTAASTTPDVRVSFKPTEAQRKFAELAIAESQGIFVNDGMSHIEAASQGAPVIQVASDDPRRNRPVPPATTITPGLVASGR